MTDIHVLTYDDKPIAAALRYERLSMRTASYSPGQQELMKIVALEVLD